MVVNCSQINVNSFGSHTGIRGPFHIGLNPGLIMAFVYFTGVSERGRLTFLVSVLLWRGIRGALCEELRALPNNAARGPLRHGWVVQTYTWSSIYPLLPLPPSFTPSHTPLEVPCTLPSESILRNKVSHYYSKFLLHYYRIKKVFILRCPQISCVVRWEPPFPCPLPVIKFIFLITSKWIQHKHPHMKPSYNKYQESNQGFLGIIKKIIFYELSYRILGVSLKETRFEVYDQFFKNNASLQRNPRL